MLFALPCRADVHARRAKDFDLMDGNLLLPPSMLTGKNAHDKVKILLDFPSRGIAYPKEKTKGERRMENKWDAILAQYIGHVVSPDGRDTFESTPKLIDELVQAAEIARNSLVLDLGCGWGNVTRACAAKTSRTVFGIDPNFQNLQEAKRRSRGENIQYLQGSFENPVFAQKADLIISSLAFHEVNQDYKSHALKNIRDRLSASGKFILCDVMLFFNAQQDAVKFNRVYRYILQKTTPKDVYTNCIAPYLDETQIYTWADMKAYTPKDFWLYSLDDMNHWLRENDLAITKRQTFCPFFGILTIEPVSKK